MLTPRTVRDLGDAPPAPHLIRNLCRDQGSILIYGHTGLGKTRLVWQMACAWARGLPAFGFIPRRPLRVCFIEADLFTQDFEEMLKEMREAGVAPPEQNLHWFTRDADEMWDLDLNVTFREKIKDFNRSNSTDITIYDAIPDLLLGDLNDASYASKSLRTLHSIACSRAYMGIMVQRKGQGDQQAQADQTEDTTDDMLGSQAWGRQASAIFKLTRNPSLVWCKARLCKKTESIQLQMTETGVYVDKYGPLISLICQEASAGYTSARDLARRVAAKTKDAGDTVIREKIADLEATGVIHATPGPRERGLCHAGTRITGNY